jgi:hypothetical protein
VPVRGTFLSQIWLHRDPSDPFRLFPRVIDVVRICKRSPSAMAGTSPDLMAALSASEYTVQYAKATSIVQNNLRTCMGYNLLRYSRGSHNDYPRKTGDSKLWPYSDWVPSITQLLLEYIVSLRR